MINKGRLFLIAFDDTVAAERARGLRAAGWTVEVESSDARRAHRIIRQLEPDLVVVDLGLRPSHGREAGRGIRGRDATRHIPIVFVGGTDKDRESVSELLPGAVFTTPADLVLLLDRVYHPNLRQVE